MAAKSSRSASKKVKINLGSGGDLLDGFINVDAFVDSPAPNFKKADIRQLPFERESVDYALLNNVLEHLPQCDVPMVLFELRRVLKTGGLAVILVPDFASIARQWISVEEGNFNAVLYHYLSEAIYGNQLHEGEYHRTAMSPKYLNFVIQMAGFRYYKLTMYVEGSRLDGIEGVTMPQGTQLRHAMIVAEITK